MIDDGLIAEDDLLTALVLLSLTLFDNVAAGSLLVLGGCQDFEGHWRILTGCVLLNILLGFGPFLNGLVLGEPGMVE
jgi:hypothetical protein